MNGTGSFLGRRVSRRQALRYAALVVGASAAIGGGIYVAARSGSTGGGGGPQIQQGPPITVTRTPGPPEVTLTHTPGPPTQAPTAPGGPPGTPLPGFPTPPPGGPPTQIPTPPVLPTRQPQLRVNVEDIRQDAQGKYSVPDRGDGCAYVEVYRGSGPASIGAEIVVLSARSNAPHCEFFYWYVPSTGQLLRLIP